MLWSPSGTSAAIGTGATPFRNSSLANLGGVARVHNEDGVATLTFTIGNSDVTNTHVIPVAPNETHYQAFGADDTHAIASAATGLRITPGIGRP